MRVTFALLRVGGPGAALLVAGLVLDPTLGCSTVLGISNLPQLSDGGTGSGGGGDGGGSGSGGSSGSSGSTSASGSSGSGSSGSSGASGSSGSSGSSAADGGGSSGSPVDSGNSRIAMFLGTWQTTGGSQTLSQCTNPGADQTVPTPTTIALTFTAGTTSDLVGTYSGQDSTGCSFLANVVSSTTATAAAGQTCKEFTSGDTEVLTLGSYSFSLSGNTAGESATGVLVDQTNPASCNVSADATYSRM